MLKKLKCVGWSLVNFSYDDIYRYVFYFSFGSVGCFDVMVSEDVGVNICIFKYSFGLLWDGVFWDSFVGFDKIYK